MGSEKVLFLDIDNLRRRAMAKKTKAIRLVITLACTECKEQNYTTQKNRRNDPGRMEINKYCPRCRHHTQHRETK